MNKEIAQIAETTKYSGQQVGKALRSIPKQITGKIEERIDFLKVALKYTNKSTLKNRHQKELLSLQLQLAECNTTLFSKSMSDYLEKAIEFAKSK